MLLILKHSYTEAQMWSRYIKCPTVLLLFMSLIYRRIGKKYQFEYVYKICCCVLTFMFIFCYDVQHCRELVYLCARYFFFFFFL